MAKPLPSNPAFTRHGFVRAAYLTDETVQAIIDTISQGVVEGQACRQHGTSYTQFLARVRKSPEWHKKLRAAEVLKMRELRRQKREGERRLYPEAEHEDPDSHYSAWV